MWINQIRQYLQKVVDIVFRSTQFFWVIGDRNIKHHPSFLVVLVVFWAFLLRYFQIGIGLPYLYFWDEPQTASQALLMMKSGDYNPHFFNYGSSMIYLNLLVDKLHYFFLTLQSSAFLQSVEDIKINADTGWHWTISHPSFYFWNRFLTAIMGVGTVFVTYVIGKEIFNHWIGLISALFLACLPIHIVHSGFVTPDVPVGFFVLMVIMFSVLFFQQKKISYFVLSLIFVGFSSATKYNAGLVLFVPLSALIWMFWQKELAFKKTYFYLIVTVPAVVFLFVMPYALLDFPTFLNHLLDEMKHYKITGHPKATSIPGWDHFVFQMANFYSHIGLVGAVLILVGFGAVFFRHVLLLVLLLPVLYIYFMVNMKVNFHRNFVQIYPFISIVIGAAFYNLYHMLELLRKKINMSQRMMPRVVCTVLVFLFLIPQAFAAYQSGIKNYHAEDTRTRVVDVINNKRDVKRVIIAKELKMHATDLKRLAFDYVVESIECMASQKYSEGNVYVLPTQISQVYTYYDTEINNKKLIIDRVDREYIYTQIQYDDGERAGVTMLDVFSVNPSIMFVTQMPHFPLVPDRIALDSCEKPSTGTKIHINNEATISDGFIKTPGYDLRSGGYRFGFEAKKPEVRERVRVFVFGAYETTIKVKHLRAFDEQVKICVSIFGDRVLLKQKVFDPTEEFGQMNVDFFLEKKQNVFIKIENVDELLNNGVPSETIIRKLAVSSLDIGFGLDKRDD